MTAHSEISRVHAASVRYNPRSTAHGGEEKRETDRHLPTPERVPLTGGQLLFWIIGITGLVLFWLMLTALSRATSKMVSESGRRLERKLDQPSASTGRLTAEVSGFGNEMNEQLEAIQRLLKPAAYIAESQVQGLEAERNGGGFQKC